MWLLGFFIGGAANIIGAACSADLGKAAIEMGMESAVSIVAGIIDGTGSVGAAVGQGKFDKNHRNGSLFMSKFVWYGSSNNTSRYSYYWNQNWMVARVLYVYGHVCLIRNDSICLMLSVRVSRMYFASIGQNGIFDKPFVSYQWYGENYEIKFAEFVSVVFLTNPNLSSTKISKTKSTQIQIMKFNSNFEKTSFKIFFIFLHILHNLQIWAYILLFRIIILFCQLEYSSFIFCTFIGIVPTALYTIKFFANFDFCFV